MNKRYQVSMEYRCWFVVDSWNRNCSAGMPFAFRDDAERECKRLNGEEIECMECEYYDEAGIKKNGTRYKKASCSKCFARKGR